MPTDEGAIGVPGSQTINFNAITTANVYVSSGAFTNGFTTLKATHAGGKHSDCGPQVLKVVAASPASATTETTTLRFILTDKARVYAVADATLTGSPVPVLPTAVTTAGYVNTVAFANGKDTLDLLGGAWGEHGAGARWAAGVVVDNTNFVSGATNTLRVDLCHTRVV